MALARKPFVVIDAEILSSSIWSESAHTKLVWLTLLILCDTDGYVGASVPGIAHAAGVSLEECTAALEIFQAPDPHSRTTSNEGRRLRIAERGFQVINFREQIDRLSRERKMSRERVRRHRAKRRNVSLKRKEPPVTPGNVSVTTGNREKGEGNREQTTEPNNQTRAREEFAPKANPFIGPGDRPKWEREALDLTAAVAELVPDMDPVEIFRQAAGYKGAMTSKTNPANLTDDRLLNTVIDLRQMLRQAQNQKAERERYGNV
jgi:hypothetical protein